MNEGSSSSASSPADSPAFAWGEGHPVRFAVADHHTQGRFAAQTIVLIDSCFTQAVYGQHAKRADERQIHSMQTLHINNEKLADDADLIVLQSYELVLMGHCMRMAVTSLNALSNFNNYILLIHYKIFKYLNSINYTYTYFITSIN